MSVLLAALLLWLPVGPGHCAPLAPLPVRVVTVYHAVPAETDDTPRVTADGTHVVNVQRQRIAAVSLELLTAHGGPVDFGDWLWVDIGRSVLSGPWQVHDTVAAGFAGYVDLLVPEGVTECWRTADAVVKYPGSCPAEASVYRIRELDEHDRWRGQP